MPSTLEAASAVLRLQPSGTCAKIVGKLRRIPGIVSIHSVSGALDMVIAAEGADIAAIERIRSTMADFPEVAEITTLIVLERHLG